MPAAGGCVRPRFFNGMFITREDLETQLRYLRIKNQLQRRADGEGVVWGLGLGRDGTAVCVQPGYAVDCCGNDLTVTSVYKVDAATLLSDPAVCNLITGEQQCMSLLLEYLECPEQPRPVHGGDPCSGQSPGCEMSRVRETVRLRLVPTRDYQPSGPIQRFLDIISRGVPTANGGGQTTAATVTSPATIPFAIAITCPTADAKIVLVGRTDADGRRSSPARDHRRGEPGIHAHGQHRPDHHNAGAGPVCDVGRDRANDIVSHAGEKHFAA